MGKQTERLGHFISEAGKREFEAAYTAAMKLLPAPASIQEIQTEFGSVRVYVFAQEENRHKEPILLLPGRSSSTPMWEPNLEGMLNERPVYAIDLLGEPGMSVQTKEIKDSRDQASWLNELLTRLELERVHLLGVSIGGWTAMNLARYFPDRIASVILLDPVFVFAPISLRIFVLSIPAVVPFVPKFIRERLLSYISGGANADDSVPIARLIESGMRNFKLALPAPDRFTAADLSKIGRPVLAFMAENSTMHNSEEAVENGKKNVKNITIENWPDASHAISGEYPDEINQRVLEFVRRYSQDSESKIPG